MMVLAEFNIFKTEPPHLIELLHENSMAARWSVPGISS
jgi:hypothetical protein